MSEQVKPAPKAYQANVFWDRQDCATLSAQVYLASDADSYIDALHAEAEALRAENGRLAESLRVAHHNLGVGFDTEAALTSQLEAARGLLRDIYMTCNPREMPSEYAIRGISNQIEALLTATPAPEVQAEQGERQEAVAWKVAYPPEYKPFMYHLSFRSEVEAVRYAQQETPKAMGCIVLPLYTTPQPGPDVRALVEALEPFADFIAGTDPAWSDDRRISTLNYDFTKLRLGLFRKAVAALAAHRQAQRKGESHDT